MNFFKKNILTLLLISGFSINVLADTTSGIVYTTQPTVLVVDEYGNRDHDYTEEVALTKNGDGTLGGDVSNSASEGFGSYSDVKYTATADDESYTLTASSGSLTSVTSSSINSDVIAT